jgi:hypothetical protein
VTTTKVYEFWFGMRKYTTTRPRLTVGEMMKMANASPLNQVYQDKFGDGPDVPFGHGEAVDVTSVPHFYCVPAATTHRGIPSD